MKLKTIFTTTLLTLLVLPMAALAFTLESPKSGETQLINDDYYTAGEQLTLGTEVNGDLVAAGGNVTLKAPVSQDAFLAGGNVYLEGDVGDDVRLVGGELRVDSNVKGDLLAAGGNLELSDRSSVGGDFVFGAGKVRILGPIQGDLLGSAGDLYIDNEIRGNVRLFNAGSVAFGPKGKVLGNFSYNAPKAIPEINAATVSGTIDFREATLPTPSEKAEAGFLAGFSIFGLMTLLFAGLFLTWLLRAFSMDSAQAAFQRHLPSLAIGFLVTFATPVACFLLLFTGVGMPMGLMLSLLWIFLIYLGKLVGILMVGSRILAVDRHSPFLRAYGAFAIGALIFVVLAMIPFLGWIARLAISLVGLGGIVLAYEKGIRSLRS